MSDKAREEFEAWFYNECCHGSGKVNYRSVVTMAAWKAWQASRASPVVNACASMAAPAAEIAEMKRQRDELLAALNLARDYVGCLDTGGPALLGLICVIDDAIEETRGSTS